MRHAADEGFPFAAEAGILSTVAGAPAWGKQVEVSSLGGLAAAGLVALAGCSTMTTGSTGTNLRRRWCDRHDPDHQRQRTSTSTSSSLSDCDAFSLRHATTSSGRTTASHTAATAISPCLRAAGMSPRIVRRLASRASVWRLGDGVFEWTVGVGGVLAPPRSRAHRSSGRCVWPRPPPASPPSRGRCGLHSITGLDRATTTRQAPPP